MNFGPLPMPNGLSRLETRFLGRADKLAAVEAATGNDLDAMAVEERASAPHSTSTGSEALRPNPSSVERNPVNIDYKNSIPNNVNLEENCRLQRGLDKWNKIIRVAGVDFVLKLPHQGFNRAIGTFAGAKVSPDGELLSLDDWDRRQGDWLPTEDDKAFIESLMGPVTEPGKFAGWIAPQAKGI